MFSHSSAVSADDIIPLIAEVDPTAPGYGHHLPFDRILRRCGLAWTQFLNETGAFDGGVIVPRLTVDYASEVQVGTLDIAITVVSIGRTSFTIRCAVSQDGRPAATVEVVLVSFGYDERKPAALTDAQRTVLSEASALP